MYPYSTACIAPIVPSRLHKWIVCFVQADMRFSHRYGYLLRLPMLRTIVFWAGYLPGSTFPLRFPNAKLCPASCLI